MDVKPSQLQSNSTRRPTRSNATRSPTPSARATAMDVKSGLQSSPAVETTTLYPQFLPPVPTEVNNHYVYLFFRFCAERHNMYNRRVAGAARDQLTEDETMRSLHVGNVFRELDPGGITIGQKVLSAGAQTTEEVVFRMILYSMFYKQETWSTLCAAATDGFPTWTTYARDMPAMEAALFKRSMVDKEKIYYGGFQLVPPTVYFTDNRNRDKSMHHYAASLRLVLAVMKAGLPAMLEQCRYAVDASNVLQTLPTFGGFLSLNVLCLLNMTDHFDWPYRTFATCGPGPRAYLKRMFGKSINSVAAEEAGLRWLHDNQWRYWARLGIDPPHATDIPGLQPGMRVLDFENALCWCHRYVAALEKAPHMRSLGDPGPPVYDPEITENAHEPAFCVEERFVNYWDRFNESASHLGPVKDEPEEDDTKDNVGTDETDEKQTALQDEDQKPAEGEVYEVEKVVGRKGKLLRVRWKGYAPEDDTWESESVLREGSEEALEEWLAWEKRVWSAIEEVKKNKPFIKPEQPTKRPERTSKRRKLDVVV